MALSPQGYTEQCLAFRATVENSLIQQSVCAVEVQGLQEFNLRHFGNGLQEFDHRVCAVQCQFLWRWTSQVNRMSIVQTQRKSEQCRCVDKNCGGVWIVHVQRGVQNLFQCNGGSLESA